MEKKENEAGEIIARRGLFYQAFGIYDGIAGFYDYGPIGLRIRKNVEKVWRRIFVDNIDSLEISTTELMPEIALKASGHVDTFTDPVINCAKCNSSYRADKLLEEYYEKRQQKEKAESVKKMTFAQMEEEIKKNSIKCAKCGNSDFKKIEKFNLMFKTHIGAGTNEVAYLRPETAQGIFVDFSYLYKTHGGKLPFAVAQIGKAYRNEISPRQQLVRLRELVQMELEVFFDPEQELEEYNGIKIKDVLKEEIRVLKAGKEKAEKDTIEELLEKKVVPNRYHALLLFLAKHYVMQLGISDDKYRFRQVEKEELPHYSGGTFDLEVDTSYGWLEISSINYRTDYDLSQHSKFSNVDLKVESNGKKVMPHVVEASMGCDRSLFSVLDLSVDQGKDRGWKWLNLNEELAPYKCAVFPLQKDDKLISKALHIYRKMKEKGIDCYYSEASSIGKRYAKADEVGVFNCITIDYQTLEDDTVTVRERKTTKQVRKKSSELY